MFRRSYGSMNFQKSSNQQPHFNFKCKSMIISNLTHFDTLNVLCRQFFEEFFWYLFTTTNPICSYGIRYQYFCKSVTSTGNTLKLIQFLPQVQKNSNVHQHHDRE
jgi:hypothetical protein